MADAAQQETRRIARGRVSVSKGLATIGTATVLLFVVSAVSHPASVSPTVAVGHAAGRRRPRHRRAGPDAGGAAGRDRPLGRRRHLAGLVIVTHIPDGDDSKLLPAVLLAVVFAIGAGVLNGR